MQTKTHMNCRALVRMAGRLLRAAGLRPDAGTLIDLIRTIPACRTDADAGPSEGLCAYCLLRAEEAAGSQTTYVRFRSLAGYFLDVMPAWPNSQRQRVERQALAVLTALVEA